MAKRYAVVAPSFLGGVLRQIGEVVELADGVKPGENLAPLTADKSGAVVTPEENSSTDTNKIQALQDTLSQKDIQIAELTSLLTQKEDSILNLKKTEKDYQTQLASLEDECAKLDKAKADLESKVKALESSLKSKDATIKDLEKSIKKLEADKSQAL